MHLRLVLAVALMSVSITAHADTVLFSYAGIDAQGFNQNVSFALPSSPAAINSYPGLRFYIDGITATVNGVTYDNYDVSFGSSTPTFGGVAGSTATGQGDFHLNTVALFSDTTANPTFVLGSYAVSSAQFGGDLLALPLSSPGTLTLSAYQPTSVTPEPSSFILLGTGCLLLVVEMTRKRNLLQE